MKHRILIVDDYPDAAEVACTLLTILGHECRFVSTGREALDEAARFEPDIALLDIGLPDLSGYEVARAMREQLAGRHLYLAAITGWGTPADKARAFEAGFDQHVTKPADVAKLREVIRRAEARMNQGTAGDHGRA